MVPERILLDLDTQRDFFDPAGSCYSPSASRVESNIHRLFLWARMRRVPIISTVLRVRRGRRGPLIDTPHCVDGSDGEMKLPKTLLPDRINLGMRSVTDLPRDLFERCQQVIIEMRQPDVFAHARIERLLTEFSAAAFVVCGTGLTTAIHQCVIGLLNRGSSVTVVSDAVLHLGDCSPRFARRRITAKGAIMARTSNVTKPPRPKRKRRGYSSSIARMDASSRRCSLPRQAMTR